MAKMKFLERALGTQNEPWRYIVVFLMAFFGGQMLGALPLIIVLMVKTLTNGGLTALNPENMLDFTGAGLSKNLVFLLMMIAAVTTLVFTVVLVKAMHRRSFAETVNGRKTVRRDRILFGFTLWFVLMAAYTAADLLLHGDNYVMQFDPGKFALLFVLSVVFVPLQTTSEELLMRGYLAQGIGAKTGSRWLAWLIPSLLFGLLHIANPEVAAHGFALTMGQYLFFGLFFGLVSILDDGIELPVGMHAANNLFLCLFTTNRASALQTDAIFEIKEINPVADFLSLAVIALILFAVFYRKYGWQLAVMTRKVTRNDIQTAN